MIGASRTQWGALALPFQFPGTSCLVSVSGDFFVYVTTDNIGQATVPLAIPNRTSLLGLRYYAQFAVNDPGATGGLTTTQAVSVKIGGWDLR